MEYMILLTVISIISIPVCYFVAKKRGSNKVFWVIMAGLFGPFAVPFVFLSKAQNG